MQGELPKSIKKKLAVLVCAAHAEALRRALTQLDEHFERWRCGELDAFEMTERIHRFHNGPARQIYKRFTYSGSADLPMLAASAVREGLVERGAVPEEVWPHLEPWLSFLESAAQEGAGG